MEERLRTVETRVEVLKNKTKVSQNRINDLERGHENLAKKVDSMLQRMNLWNGAIIAILFMLPFYMELVTGRQYNGPSYFNTGGIRRYRGTRVVSDYRKQTSPQEAG